MKRKLIFNIISFLAAAVAIVLMFSMENKMSTGIDKSNLDISVRPADNFYDFASAGWRKKNPLRPEFSRFGAFDKLGEKVLEQTQDLIKEIAEGDHEAGGLEQKIATMYNSAMDYEKRNKDGLDPVRAEIAEIDGIKNIAEYLGAAHRADSPFWEDGVSIDAMDSGSYIFGIGQGGLGLSRDYLLDDDDKSKEIRRKYKKYMADVFLMFGISDAPADKIYELEIEMAKSFYPKEKLRDPHANYHKFSYADFKKKFAGFDWNGYFSARGITPDFIDVGQPEPLQKSLGILKSKDQSVLRAYLKWRVA
ncbi:MAG: M13 family metallopeptidase, partial [Rickettsiales bacterium]|nr:M13 family metallopeptidase [Rickettsiales bacterium]